MTEKQEEPKSDLIPEERIDRKTGDRYTPYSRSMIFGIDQTSDVGTPISTYKVDANGNPMISHTD